MYPNLEAELARNDISKTEIAEFLGVRQATVYDKLNGNSSIKLDEALAIKREFFSELNMEYLFKKRGE